MNQSDCSFNKDYDKIIDKVLPQLILDQLIHELGKKNEKITVELSCRCLVREIKNDFAERPEEK